MKFLINQDKEIPVSRDLNLVYHLLILTHFLIVLMILLPNNCRLRSLQKQKEQTRIP